MQTKFDFIAIMKYNLFPNEQKTTLYLMIKILLKILDKIPLEMREFLKIKELKIFPVFVSNNFCKTKIIIFIL